MKNNFILIFVFTTSLAFGQNRNCNCLESLNEVSELIKDSKSYKIQIKKRKEPEFETWKKTIRQEILKDSLSDYFCTGYLQKYISFIKDKHNQIYSIPSNIPTHLKKIEISKNTSDNISGVYYAGTESIIVTKETDNVWYGILLESSSEKWKKGMIRLRINKTKNGLFEIFEYYKNGFLYYQKNIKIDNGRIYSTFWNKGNKYFFNKNHKENFTFNQINTDFDYIGIKTLERTRKLMKESLLFYDSIKYRLNKKNLIIDLRNNGGGSTEQIKHLISHIRNNKYIKKIFVLINFKTASAAELGAFLLKKDSRTILVGENSRGMLTYGYGNNAISGRLSCKEIEYTFSRKQTNEELLKYEGLGLSPELKLKNTSEWINQIIEFEINN